MPYQQWLRLYMFQHQIPRRIESYDIFNHSAIIGITPLDTHKLAIYNQIAEPISLQFPHRNQSK